MKIVLGFSFGNRGQEPGTSNEAMAEVIHLLAPDVISIQWEIGKALRRIGVIPRHEVLTHRQVGRYLDTEEVMRQMIIFLQTLNLHNETIFIVAHPDHLSRCVRILKKLGVKRVVQISACIPYDPQSHQIWVRSRFLFRIREMLAFPIYLFRGYYTA